MKNKTSPTAERHSTVRLGILDIYEIVGDMRYGTELAEDISEASTDIGSNYMIATIHDDVKERVAHYSIARGLALELRELLANPEAHRCFDKLSELNRARAACDRLIATIGEIRDDELRAQRAAVAPTT